MSYCKQCGSPEHAYCKKSENGHYILGHPEWVGKIINSRCTNCGINITSRRSSCACGNDECELEDGQIIKTYQMNNCNEWQNPNFLKHIKNKLFLNED